MIWLNGYLCLLLLGPGFASQSLVLETEDFDDVPYFPFHNLYAPGETAHVTLRLATAARQTVALEALARRLPEGPEQTFATKRVEVSPDAPQAVTFDLNMPEAGAQAVRVVARRGDETLADFHAAVHAGEKQEAMVIAAPPKRASGLQLPPHVRHLERANRPTELLETPHFDWAEPYAAGPLRAVFLVPAETPREAIELAQRLSLEWTLIPHGLDEEGRLPEFGWGYWESYFALLAKATVWAARREADVTMTGLSPAVLPLKRGAALQGEPRGEVMVFRPGHPQVRVELRARTATTAQVEATWRAPDGGKPLPISDFGFRISDFGFRTRPVRLAPDQPTAVTLRLPLSLPAGPHCLDVVVRDGQGRVHDWGMAVVRVLTDLEVLSLTPDQEFYDPEEAVTVTASVRNRGAEAVTLTGRAELTDAHGRLVTVQEQEVILPPSAVQDVLLMLQPPRPLTTLHTLTWTLRDAQGPVAQATCPVYRPLSVAQQWEDVVFFTWTHEPAFYLRRPFHGLLRELGLNAVVGTSDEADLRSWLEDDLHFVLYGGYGGSYYLGKEPVRQPCYNDPPVREGIRPAYENFVRRLRKYGPLAHAMGDESSLSTRGYGAEVCFCEHCRARFREWAQARYRPLEAANALWGTAFADWEAVEPIDQNAAKERENPALWMDFRTFMEDVWMGMFADAKAGVEATHPEMLFGFPNTFGLYPFSGDDYWKHAQHITFSQEYPYECFGRYSSENHYDLLRSFTDVPMPGWIGYTNEEEAYRFQAWWVAFHGGQGASYFMSGSAPLQGGYYVHVHPLLAPTLKGLWLRDNTADLRRGIGKILKHARRAPAPVAIFYSQASMYLSTLDGTIDAYHASRNFFTALLQDLGFPYNFVAPEQIAAGELEKYRALLFPHTSAVSDAVLARVLAFAQAGGLVIADGPFARADEHGRPQDADARRKALRDTGRLAYFAETPQFDEAWRDALGRVLAQGGLRPEVEITCAGQPVIGYERILFENGPLRYLGVLRDFRVSQGEEEVEIRLSKPVGNGRRAVPLIYDVRAGAYLGQTDRFQAAIRPGAAAFYALLPYRVEAVAVRVAEGSHPTGEPVGTIPAKLNSSEAQFQRSSIPAKLNWEARVNVASGLAGDHVLRVEVADPQGEPVAAYTCNVLAAGGRYEGRVLLALNDPAGMWTLAVTDVTSGVSGRARFAVTRRQGDKETRGQLRSPGLLVSRSPGLPVSGRGVGRGEIHVTVASRRRDVTLENQPITLRYLAAAGVSPEGFAVVTADGRRLPCQVDVLRPREACPERSRRNGTQEVEIGWAMALGPQAVERLAIRYGPEAVAEVPRLRVAVEPPDPALGMARTEDGWRLTNARLEADLDASLHLRRVSCGGIPVSGSTSESFHWCNPHTPDEYRAVDREWQEEQTEIVTQGPLHWTLRTEGRCVNPDLRENWRRIVEVTLWANRPVLHYRFTYVNDSPEAKLFPGGESTYLVTWYPLPGGAMSTLGQPQGDDYLACVPKGETTVRTTRLLDLPQQYSMWFHPDPAEQWLDFFDAAEPSCGIGILYPEEPRFGGGIYNDGYREPPIKRDQPFWFLNLPEVFKNRAVPPGGAVSCPILFVPHPGDYHTTQQVWRGLDAVEVFAEEYMGIREVDRRCSQ